MSADDTSKLAERYSRALFDLANKDGKLDAVEKDMAALKEAIAQVADLPQLFANPLPPRLAKAKAIDAVLAKFRAAEVTRNFAKQLAYANRLPALPSIIDRFESLMIQHRGGVVLEVISAKQLTKQELDAISASLAKKYGKNVLVKPSVDPSLMGGLIVKAGGTMLDYSLKNKLARLERELKTQTA